VIEQLLPPAVVSVEAFGDLDGEPVFPGEEPLVAKAVAGRRREFVTARRCAREALGKLGYPAAPIGAGPRREPLWPAGVAGTITHCTGYRAAAVARIGELSSIGIDAEPHAALPPGVAEAVTTAAEPAMLAALADADPSVHWDRLLFSAKEAVYKAWFPLTGRWLDFGGAELTIEPATRSFRARLLVDGSRTDGAPPLTGFEGRFLTARGLVLAAVTVTEASSAP
jgi:enterobactin synthetase component D / holo-[acyl-carrier protein] synthase